MIDVRIVCTHDALKVAEMLVRLLEAEQHRVRLTFGRQALHELENRHDENGAVVVVWSPDARSQIYMIEWARSARRSSLIEIARGASDWPALNRQFPVIDFTSWRGERGARCWKTLNERLGAIERSFEPRKPIAPKALLAVGIAGAAAAAVFAGVRVSAPSEQKFVAIPLDDVVLDDPAAGMGGPLRAIEPASMDDNWLDVGRYPNLQPLTSAAEPLSPIVELQDIELRDSTIRERIEALNPLRRDDASE